MRIESARIFEVFPPPFARGVSDATLGPFYEAPVGWLELTTSEGVVGWGMAPVGVIARELLGEVFLPAVCANEIEMSVAGVAANWERCAALVRNMGAGLTYQTLSSIDYALWDILGKTTNQSLVRLLGGTRTEIPVYGSNGWVNYDLPTLVESMVRLRERGFSALKMKIGVERGTNIAEDVRRVKAVRRAIGGDTGLAVDVNQCWTVDEALEFARSVRDENILWFEEPIHALDFIGAESFARESPIPLAAGESLSNEHQFRSLFESKSLSYAQPVSHTVGGITNWWRIARAAHEYDVPIVSGGFSQLTCSLVAAAPTGRMTEYLVPFMDSFQECLASAPALSDGHFRIPDAPGHGLAPDINYVASHSRGAPHVFALSHRGAVRSF